MLCYLSKLGDRSLEDSLSSTSIFLYPYYPVFVFIQNLCTYIPGFGPSNADLDANADATAKCSNETLISPSADVNYVQLTNLKTSLIILYCFLFCITDTVTDDGSTSDPSWWSRPDWK